MAPTIIVLPAGENLIDRVFLALSAKGAVVTREDVEEKVENGDIGLIDNSRAFIHRPVRDETEIDLPIIVHNDRIIVIDKPSGIATTPQGAYVARSVLVQARRRFGSGLVCAHRLDRATSGVLLLVREPHMRRAYHGLFSDGAVSKTYEFLAPSRDAVPATYSSRIERRGTRMWEVPGPINSITDLRLAESRGPWGRYEALPRTGQMHQIRAHAAAIGIPIYGDTLYGHGEGFPDWIGLVARSLSFTDPFDGQQVTAVSRHRLRFPHC